MQKFFKATLLAVSLCSLLSSCGVMFGGSRYEGNVLVKGHPDAEIYINGQMTGKGKSTGAYKRNRPLIVEVKQEGCEPKKVTFPHTFRTGNFILSVITWGGLGVLVDLTTGAAFKPDHNIDSNIERMSTKTYLFKVDYNECPK